MKKEGEVVNLVDTASRSGEPKLNIPRRPELREAIQNLRDKKPVSDMRFDAIYPWSIQNLSEPHWTPVRVAKRAAELLVKDKNSKILDVGSGAGKFCMIGALTTQASFLGIEQRGYLTDMCRQLIRHHQIERVDFIHGNMMSLDWSKFDGFYLYNPFIENLYDEEHIIDQKVALTEAFYERYIRLVQLKLHLAPAGTRVVTYHGFGGDMPPNYVLRLREPMGSDRIEFWEKPIQEMGP